MHYEFKTWRELQEEQQEADKKQHNKFMFILALCLIGMAIVHTAVMNIEKIIA